MGPLQQTLMLQDIKIFPQRGLTDFEERRQFLHMDPSATRDKRGDLRLSLGGKNGGYEILAHSLAGENGCHGRYLIITIRLSNEK